MKRFRSIISGIVLLILFWVISTPVSAQNKIESEERIKGKEVPDQAKDWLHDTFEKIKKPKWYREYFENGMSYEAKFLYDDSFYSVEFSSLGEIEDVEVEIEFGDLDHQVRENLKEYFTTNYTLSKIEKIQIQYSGDEDDLEDFFDEDEDEGIQVQYEIEYAGKDADGEYQLWEGTFDHQGVFLGKRKIILRPADNLVF